MPINAKSAQSVYKGLQCQWKWEALDSTSMHESICCCTSREKPYHKIKHQAKSHLSSTLSRHQMRDMGNPKVFWKSTILNCHKMLFHDVRPIEHATKIFEFLQKPYKDTPIMIRYLELIFLNYGSAIGDSYPSACYLISYCVVIHLLMETVKELWDHFSDSFERQNIDWDKTWSSSTDADLISSTYSLVRQHAWQA